MQFSFAGACKDENNVYLFDRFSQAVISYSVIDDRFRLEAVYSGDKIDPYHIFVFENKLYITMIQKLDILNFDLNTRQFEYISACEIGDLTESNRIYDHHMMSERKVWSFPRALSDGIFYYDIDSGKYFEYGSIVKLADNITLNNEETHFSSSDDSSYVAGVFGKNIYVVLDLKCDRCTSYELNDIKYELNAAAIDGKSCWFSCVRDKAVLRYEGNKEIYIDNKERSENIENYSKIFCFKKHVIFLPFQGTEILIIDRMSYEIKKVDLCCYSVEKDDKDSASTSKMISCIEFQNRYMLFGYGENMNLFIGDDGETISNLTIELSDDEKKSIFDKKLSKNNLLHESDEFGLTDFIQNI